MIMSSRSYRYFFFSEINASLSKPRAKITSKKFLLTSKAIFFVILKLQAITPPNALIGSDAKAFLKDSNGDVKGIKTINVDFVDGKLTEIDGTEKTWDAELVLLSMGFLSPEHYLSDDANIELDERGNYQSKHGEFNTSRKGVFSAGDCRRGQSLVVWAINEGRGVANSVNSFLLNS